MFFFSVLNAAINNKTYAYGVLIDISNVNLISVRQGQIKCVGGLSRSFVIVYNNKKWEKCNPAIMILWPYIITKIKSPIHTERVKLLLIKF